MTAARYRWDDFVLDLDTYRLARGQALLALEPKAFELLALLVGRPGHLFTKQEIFAAIWPDTAVTDHALTRVIAQLRRVLGDDAREPRYIETVPSKGYRWAAPVDIDRLQAVSVPGTPPPVSAESPPPPASLMTRRTWRLAAAMAVLVMASLAFGLYVVTRRSREGLNRSDASATASDPHPVTARWPVQLTTHAGLDVHPDLSPLGDAIAYASDRSGAFEIYVRALGDNSRDTAITSDGGHNVQPAWSRDGRYLAYHSSCRGGIWVVPARGGTPRQVAPTGSKPAWSPDGTRIAFQSDEQLVLTPSAYNAQHGSTLWTVAADGSDLRQITRVGQPLGGHAAPAWTPDGKRLAFTVFEGGEDDGLWIVPLDASTPRPLLRRGGLFELVFDPDGSALYVTTGDAAIVRLPFDAATGALHRGHTLIPIGGVPAVRGLSIAADGSRLAFGGIALSSQIWAQPITRDGAAAGAARALTNDRSRRNSLPAISPDGSKIAYMSKRSGAPPHVWIMDSDGRNGTQVTAADAGDWLPSWFPDSRRVAYLSYRGSRPELWTVDIETRREALLVAFDAVPVLRSTSGLNRSRLAELALAPSKTRVAFSVTSRPSGRRMVSVTPLDRFTAQPVTGDTSVSIGYPAWSPDERLLAVELKDGSSMHAAVVDVATGVVRRLTNERGQTWVRSWSPDGRKIAAAALRDGSWDLRSIDVATGQQQTITPPAPANVYVRYPEWSPLGDRVVFERGELGGNIWTLTLR